MSPPGISLLRTLLAIWLALTLWGGWALYRATEGLLIARVYVETADTLLKYRTPCGEYYESRVKNR